MARSQAANLPRIAILGTGRLGSVLAVTLSARGWPITALWNRHLKKAQVLRKRLTSGRAFREPARAAAAADAVFLTVPDDAIRPLATRLAAAPVAGKTYFHTAGAKTAAELEPLARAGAAVGTLHPLQTFATVEAGRRAIRGIGWAVDGDDSAVELASRIVRACRGRVLRVPAAGRVLYHAAAVVASNYLVALAEQAGDLMAAAGVDPQEGLAALVPLMEGTLENLRQGDAAAALTGPVARGDAATIRRHLKAIEHARPEAARLYRLLGERCLVLAQARGLEPGLVTALKKALRS